MRLVKKCVTAQTSSDLSHPVVHSALQKCQYFGSETHLTFEIYSVDPRVNAATCHHFWLVNGDISVGSARHRRCTTTMEAPKNNLPSKNNMPSTILLRVILLNSNCFSMLLSVRPMTAFEIYNDRLFLLKAWQRRVCALGVARVHLIKCLSRRRLTSANVHPR